MTNLHRVRGAPGAAQGRRRARQQVRPRLLPRAPPRTGRKTTELWEEAGKLGYLGVAIPEEYGGGGGDIGDLAAVCEELAAAGSPLLLMVVSPAIVGTIIAQYGTDEQKQRWLPGLADGTATYRVLHHRAGCRVELAQDHHDGLPRATTAAGGYGRQDVHLRRRRGRATCWSSPAPRMPRPATSSRRCSSCRPTPRASRTSEIDMGIVVAGEAVHAVLRRRPAARRRAGRQRGRRHRAALRRPQPRADHGRLVRTRHRPARAGEGRRVRQGAPGLEGADRRAPGHRAPAGADRTSRSRWPG